MSIFIEDTTLRDLVCAINNAINIGGYVTLPSEHETLTLWGHEIMEVNSTRIELENDFQTFDNKYAYLCSPIKRGGRK